MVKAPRPNLRSVPPLDPFEQEMIEMPPLPDGNAMHGFVNGCFIILPFWLAVAFLLYKVYW